MNLLNQIKGKEISWFKVSTKLNFNDTITFYYPNSEQSFSLFHYWDSLPYFTNVETYYTDDEMFVHSIDVTSKEYPWDFTALQTCYTMKLLNYEWEVISTINYLVHENEHIGTYFIK